MTLEQKVILSGDKSERIRQAMEYAGWFPGRNVDITEVEKYYSNIGIKLFPKALNFFREFYGIETRWGIDTKGLNFDFNLFPYSGVDDLKDYIFEDSDCTIYSEDYKYVQDTANEKIVLLGIIGYYYPAIVWIGESGCLYVDHDYDIKIRVFDDIFDFIEFELEGKKMQVVYMEKIRIPNKDEKTKSSILQKIWCKEVVALIIIAIICILLSSF